MKHVSGGRHFLQIPGPTAIPDRISRALSAPVIDHRGPGFSELTGRVLGALGPVFGTDGPVVMYPSSGTGAWEAALANTLSPGDSVLCFDIGQFSWLWSQLAGRLGLRVRTVPGDWRHGVRPEEVESALAADTSRQIKAVLVVHNETSTGVTSDIAGIRAAIDRAGHDALLLVDAVSSLGSLDYRHDEWGVDVTIAGSQKGLMLPPGLGFNAISERALAAAKSATLPRAYFDWAPIMAANQDGFFPYTPPIGLLTALDVALDMLAEEGLDQVHQRHARLGAATRACVRGWGLDLVAADPREYSDTVSAVLVPPGADADAIRALVLDRFDMSLGVGLGRLAGKVFRIGHLGHINDLTLAGALAGVQMGLTLAGLGVDSYGLLRGLDQLTAAAQSERT